MHSNTTLVKVKFSVNTKYPATIPNSNTTLVKVKSYSSPSASSISFDSNTTLVKVKSFSTFASNFVISIQIQLLLKLNIYLGGVTATFLNSNTTLVKVK